MSKEMKYITEITTEWIGRNYPNASAADRWKHKDRVNRFLEYLGLTDAEFLEGFKRTKDHLEWSKKTGDKVVEFYNMRIARDHVATNTARGEASTIRAFCRDNTMSLIVARRKIAKPRAATNEHEFSRDELARMYNIGDLREKAILATAVSLGFSVEDFSELPRELIESLVNKAIAEKIDFIPFDFVRGKTGIISRSHLTPEARDALKAWLDYTNKKRESEGKAKAKYVWSNGNGEETHLREKALNEVIKSLVQKAGVVTTGRIHFHLIRKFLMGSLHDAGLSDWDVKRAVGKEIPTSDSTYLTNLSRSLDSKFEQVYPYIRLRGYTNKNGLRIEELQSKVQALEIAREQQELEIEALKRILEFSVPKDALTRAIKNMAKEGIIDAEKTKQALIDLSKGRMTIAQLTKLLEARTERIKKSE